MSIILPTNFTPVMPYNRRDNYTIRNDFYFVTASTQLLLFFLSLLFVAFSLYKAYNNINQDKIGVDPQPKEEVDNQQLVEKNEINKQQEMDSSNHMYKFQVEEEDMQQDEDQNYQEEEQQIADSSNEQLQRMQSVIKLQSIENRIYRFIPILAVAFFSIFNFSADVISGSLVAVLMLSVMVFGVALHNQLCVNTIPYIISIAILVYHLGANQKVVVQSYTQNKIG